MTYYQSQIFLIVAAVLHTRTYQTKIANLINRAGRTTTGAIIAYWFGWLLLDLAALLLAYARTSAAILNRHSEISINKAIQLLYLFVIFSIARRVILRRANRTLETSHTRVSA